MKSLHKIAASLNWVRTIQDPYRATLWYYWLIGYFLGGLVLIPVIAFLFNWWLLVMLIPHQVFYWFLVIIVDVLPVPSKSKF